MSAHEILSLADRAGVRPGVDVLDLCCGVAGPGLLITRAFGCTYVGVDQSSAAIAMARRRARTAGVSAAFRVARIPPVPSGPFEVVLLVETLLAFRDKRTLLQEISSTLPLGGRFAFTVEEGEPLSPREREEMPAAETVWLTRLPDLLSDLEGAGFRVRWSADLSRSHLAAAEALANAYAAARSDFTATPDAVTADDLVASHRLWSRWLRAGRVRKRALVAEKVSTGKPCGPTPGSGS